MLPVCLWQYLHLVLNPIIGGFFPTRGAKSGFASVVDCFECMAVIALIELITQEFSAAREYFDDIRYNRFTNQMAVLYEERPPVVVV